MPRAGAGSTIYGMLHRSTRALSVLLLLPLAGCHHDDVTTPGQPQTAVLHHDGSNAAAPNLPAATWRAAARFTSAQTAPLAGGMLTEVEFYISAVPTGCKIEVYGPGTATTPGALLYSADVIGSVQSLAWNTHALQSPVTVPNGDLWIAVEFDHATTQHVIGCDPGPRVADGDWLWSSLDGNWATFANRYAGDVNWNIRGTVEYTP